MFSRVKGKNWLRGGAIAFVLSCPVAHAVTAVAVADASQLTYVTDPSGKVYLRNVNTYAQGQALGCCYNYYIDTTTVEGKLLFSIFLASAARNSTFNFYIPDYPATGSITFGGSF